MLAASFTSPTAAPQYSTAYYSQPTTSLAYGQHSTSGIYSNYTNQSQLQGNTSLTAAAQAHLAAASLRGSVSSPEYLAIFHMCKMWYWPPHHDH